MASTPPHKAIGSVFADAGEEAADPADSLWRHWTGSHDHCAAFQTARCALHALLSAEGARRLWAPAYICEAAMQGVPQGCAVRFYDHGPNLPLADLAPEAGDAVLGVDYFGRIDPALVARANTQRDVLWIEDRAQALDGGEAWGDVLLYSPRKLIGVGDGGLMVSNRPLPQPSMATPEDEGLCASHLARSRDPDGLTPALWSPAFQAREAGFDAAPRAMQRRTLALLQSIALQPIRQRRMANFRRLQALLPEFALWPAAADFAPLAFPIRVDDAGEAVRVLAAERLYCARHWADLPSPAEVFPDAHALSRQLVSLPCDQRYDAMDMERIGEAVRRLCRPAAGSR